MEKCELADSFHLDLDVGGLVVDIERSIFRTDDAEALTPLVESTGVAEGSGLDRSTETVPGNTDGFIAIIESRIFIGECIRRSMQSAFGLPIQIFRTSVNSNRSVISRRV